MRMRSRSCARWFACPPTRRPATTRGMRSIRRRCSKRWATRSSAIRCRERDVHAAGLISVTNLIVRRRFGAGPVIALNAHGDVVPPGEGWTRPPYDGVVEDGRMYGRGVAVSKSDFATYAFALRALESRGEGIGRPARRHDRAAFHLRRGVRRRARARVAARERPHAVRTSRSGRASRMRSSLRTTVACSSRSACTVVPRTPRCRRPASMRSPRRRGSSMRCTRSARSTRRGIRASKASRRRRSTSAASTAARTRTSCPPRSCFKLDRRMIPEEDPASVEAELRARDRARGGAIAGHSRRDPPPAAGPRARAEARPRAPGGAAPDATRSA